MSLLAGYCQGNMPEPNFNNYIYEIKGDNVSFARQLYFHELPALMQYFFLGLANENKAFIDTDYIAS